MVITILGIPFLPAKGTIPARGCTKQVSPSKYRVARSSESLYFTGGFADGEPTRLSGRLRNEIPPIKEFIRNFRRSACKPSVRGFFLFELIEFIVFLK